MRLFLLHQPPDPGVRLHHDVRRLGQRLLAAAKNIRQHPLQGCDVARQAQAFSLDEQLRPLGWDDLCA